MLKHRTKKKAAIVSVLIIAMLCFAGVASANSAGYNASLPAAGGHATLCQTTKGNTNAKASNKCTSFTNSNNNWSWSWWVDNVTTGQQVTNTQVIGAPGTYSRSYTTRPAVGASVRGRGSTNGLFSAAMTVKGTINFDAS